MRDTALALVALLCGSCGSVVAAGPTLSVGVDSSSGVYTVAVDGAPWYV